jgi:hypothetical protein
MKKKCSSCKQSNIPEKYFYTPSNITQADNTTVDQQLDIIFGYFVSNWKRLGYTPIIILRLLERGWDAVELRDVLTELIGEDFTEIKISEWIDRLEKKGVVFPGEEGNEPPLVDVLDSLIFNFVQQKAFKEIIDDGDETVQH